MDLIKRLRAHGSLTEVEAADEIVRLQAAVRDQAGVESDAAGKISEGGVMTLERQIDEIVDILATLPDDKVNPDTWRRLLIYVPKWLVRESCEKERRRLESVFYR